METNFSSKAVQHFQYLITDYAFIVKKSETSKRSPETEGRIEFENSSTFVTVSSEQWVVGASVGRVIDDKYRYFLNPLTIREFTVLTESDKKMILSLDPKDDTKARMILRQIRSFHQRDISNDATANVDAQLADYSRWLRQYAEAFLHGNFAQWLQIYEYQVSAHRAAHIRSGKKEFVRTTSQIKDEQISIFQNSLDYLARLREEYGKK